MTAPRLHATLGYSSLTGPRPRNEDFCGAVTPEGPELDAKGILAVVADGVGGHANGREASEYTVRGLLSDYYATPDTWAVNKSLDTVLTPSTAGWSPTRRAPAKPPAWPPPCRPSCCAGAATTWPTWATRASTACAAGKLELLSTDHVWEHPNSRTCCPARSASTPTCRWITPTASWRPATSSR
jgi:protein phosphatase